MSLLDIFLSLPVYPLQVRILGILLVSDMEKLKTLHQFRNENCKLEKDWNKKVGNSVWKTDVIKTGELGNVLGLLT